jgi:hypothetical protein
MREDAIRHPQPAHVGVLVGRHIEQAEEAPAEIVRRLGILVARGLRLQALVTVERMQLALEFFLLGEFAAGFDDAILRARMLGIRADRLGRRRRRRRRTAGWPRRLGDLQAGHETFEIALLFGVEIAGHWFRSWLPFCALLTPKHQANGRRRPGLLQSSKDRAKASCVVFFREIRLRCAPAPPSWALAGIQVENLCNGIAWQSGRARAAGSGCWCRHC